MIETGKITERSVKTGLTGDKEWQRVSVTVNGKVFSSFNPIDAMVSKGDDVEIEYDQKGKYNNIKSMVVHHGKQETFGTVSSNVSNGSDTNKRISRMASINSAIALLELVSKVSPEKAKTLFNEVEPLKAIIDIAESLRSWIYEEKTQ